MWWGTEVECASAFGRLERQGVVHSRTVGAALDRLYALKQLWHEVEPSEPLRRTAVRLLRVHPLRAADALQLAAAIQAAEDDPSSLPFVSLDDRLSWVAEREGFTVVDLG